MTRRQHLSSTPCLLGVLSALALGCSGSGTTRADEPDAGTPFPNRREPFELPDELGVVSNSGDDTLTLVDLSVPEVIGSAGVGLDPVDLDGPHHVALDRARGEVLTALSYPVPPVAPGPHAGHGGSQRRGAIQRLALADLSPLGELDVETNPGDIVLSDDGSLLVVSHFDLVRAQRELDVQRKRATLALVDPRTIGTADPAASFVTTCAAPHGIALSRPTGDRAYVACFGEDALAIVDTTNPRSTPELVSLGPGGQPGRPFYGPYAAVMSPDGALIAVSTTESPGIHLFDVEQGRFVTLATPTDGATPYFIAWSGRDMFVPWQSPDGVARIGAFGAGPDAKRSFTGDECVKPHEAVVSHSNRIFLVCEGDHVAPGKLLELDAGSLATLAELEVGVYPDRLAIGAAQ